MKVLKIFLISILFSVTLFAQDNVVEKVEIKGNAIISNAKIFSNISSRAGQIYNENFINSDQKKLMSTGFFEYVNVEKEEIDNGVVITFVVKEKPVLDKLIIDGARAIHVKKIQKKIDIKEGSFIDEYNVKETIKKIKDLYVSKGFTQVQITYKIEPLKDNKVDVRILIKENTVLKVRKVTVRGNKEVRTKNILKLLKTKKAWMLNRGVFNEDTLEDDVKRVRDYYRSIGYSDAMVSMDVSDIRKGVEVIVNVTEGKRYYIGNIEIRGNEVIGLQELTEAMTLSGDDVFSEMKVYENSSIIRGSYMDKGYVFASVNSFNVYNKETEKIDLIFDITENKVAYVEEIKIQGNTRTRDKIIRRELRIYPGEKYDGAQVRKSKQRLDNLGFFKEVMVKTEPGSESNLIDLVFDVKEEKTGQFGFGGGYSSIDSLIGFIELRQRNFDYKNWKNFTGGGQDLSLYFSTGSVSKKYQLSFTNPWIYDRPISFGFDFYRKGHSKDDDVGYGYDEDVMGGDLRLGREFNDQVRGTVAYRYETVDISDVDRPASAALLDEEGETALSSTEFSLSYDTRDNVFSPRKGLYFSNSFDFFGKALGGDRDFFKVFSRLSLYFPMFNESVLELRARGGFAKTFGDTETIPLYKRFYAGGAATIRGYSERSVGPMDEQTEDPIGGERVFIGNIEYTYPLADFLKVASFFDIGKVWGGETTDVVAAGIKSSIGCGLRVKTPIGPVSIDYGWPLDLEPGEDSKEGRLHFNISHGF
ncbi:MAG: outer membrane protein assembly factor BamA [Candidatus Omnitrophica bacterium]|nr:outer membrane protein assembly factor BamA [Candidatus Omnitrophota bacterium]MDD5080416.1 outer membrane protein assembly factor BamA [Candidatus Omnitrophota bacterium]MDD5441096.1 outer membrane protein assembly factor BamA [Candidatus Omnitrophota bacterium]